MNVEKRKIKVFAGNSNKELALKICKELDLPLGDASVDSFSDGEIAVNIDESVRGADVYVIQSTSAPLVNRYLMELLILIDALKRASAARINAVIPYYGYARQDRKAKARDPISAKLVANLLTTAGADRVVSMDLHASQIQGYFDIPVDHLLGVPILAKYFKELHLKDVAVVSPDLGSVTRARKFADIIDASLAIIDKRRPKANVAEVMNLIGDVNGKNVILIDDMIDTAGTITQGVKALKEFGAKDVYACCTHPVLSGPAIERLKDSKIKEIVVLDTILLPEEKKLPNMKILSVAPIFAEAIKRIYGNESVSKLFD
ncbi:ribose-phosphate diphosphokinase [Paramaledivibacter caminithermalis]|uniref:Ribose-phosphate pyrophosphokinase n=1 Tax=Paramaledivibacter caminithermalis (strain DSM 15212 / CIP 107654 / DViRD3) TaxID=1121301 RepID=A0A1M6QMV9_PARC5|nr:ribose-phosphate pyrophosphokinase [Paramaledivibacter caminithermalis]SHK21440.1 ribose-phosphate pyrophosphokinase [Paramaledivibacter caminithermalis DSM 15212]